MSVKALETMTLCLLKRDICLQEMKVLLHFLVKSQSAKIKWISDLHNFYGVDHYMYIFFKKRNKTGVALTH